LSADRSTPGAARCVTAFGPGRVNLIGEHTDYNCGLALPFAIERGVTVTAEPVAARRIEVEALDLGEADQFDLDGPEPVSGWRAFVRGVVAELAAAGVDLVGARLTIAGDLPSGAGLSSSAAVEVALALALITVSGACVPDRTELARLCSRVENEWVGARTGLLDQLTSLYGESGHCLRIDFRTLEVRPVALDLGDHRLVMLDSGSPRVNAASGYNERRAECTRACELLGIPSLREARLEMVSELPEPLDRRVRHVVRSNGRVDQAITALEGRDIAALGGLLDESHASLRDDYEVSAPQVEDAVRALKAAGALGARIMGGGFGGHVVGLFPPGAIPPSGSFEVRPGSGARVSRMA
jgi:galactokinase